MKIAKKDDWKTKEFPVINTKLALNKIITKQEFEKVKIGLIPQDMDDKWFIYFDKEWLYFHRSWTGDGVYKVRFEKMQDKYQATEAIVSQNINQVYSDEDMISFLIDRLLLAKDVSFPIHIQDSNQLFQQAVIGNGRANLEKD